MHFPVEVGLLQNGIFDIQNIIYLFHIKNIETVNRNNKPEHI